MEAVYFKIPQETRTALLDMARSDDVTPGQILRGLLDREITRRRKARPPARADERLVAPLRARLGGGLALHDWPGGRRLCKASELGFSYSRLMRRFRAPFPGHAHDWLAERMLGQDDDEAVDLIEPD